MRGFHSNRSLLAAAVLLVSLAGPALGETGTLHTLAGAGLTVTIDTRWVSGGGYRPVKIDVVPLAPPPADRTLTVELVVRRYWSGRPREDRTVQRIEIPAGSGPVQTTLSVPENSAWHMYQINVLEDGKLIPSLSTSGPGDSAWCSGYGEAFPAMLIVSDGTADTTEVAKVFPAEAVSQLSQYYSGTVTSTPNGPMLPTAIDRPASELPERWIDYSSLDVVCLSLDQLQGLANGRPRAFRAIVEWTAAGGNLVVYGVGGDWRRLAKLESLVGLPPGEAAGDLDPAARGWMLPGRTAYVGDVRGNGFPNFPADGYLRLDNAGRTTIVGPAAKPDRPPFVVRELDRGMLVVMASASPFPGTRYEWGWMLATLGPKRVLWYQRHGLSSTEANTDFWKFLIPGVGLVPVGGFRVLITLFVIVIGPVSYFLLRRLKRLHLLLVTTPACAAVVTALLFGYAILADGLGTRVRVRSATHFDQRAGRAVTWSWLSYYAGLAPSRGLVFPADVAVTSLNYAPVTARSGGREMIWEGDQRLVSGWLASRTPTQFVTVRARPSERGLTVREPSQGDSGGLRIENRLATRIVRLFLRGKDGRYWSAADVADGAAVELTPANPASGLTSLAELERPTSPAYPPDMDAGGPDIYGSIVYTPRYGYGRYAQSGAPAPTQATGRLEDAIAALRPRPGPPLEPGSYLAVVERSPEVALGTDSAEEVGSFHLVSGTW